LHENAVQPGKNINMLQHMLPMFLYHPQTPDSAPFTSPATDPCPSEENSASP